MKVLALNASLPGGTQLLAQEPGKCFQSDDMQMLHPKLRAADGWVFATPLYTWGVAGPLKIMMERSLPLV